MDMKMKETVQKITIRMTAEQKKMLDELVLNSRVSINQTVINLIQKTKEINELKTDILSTKDQVNLLMEVMGKQNKAIIDLIGALKNKGVI